MAAVVTPAARRTRPALTIVHDWRHLLADACAGRHVRAVYQPLVDLRSGQVVGYEGLTRFGAGDVCPEKWFAAARTEECDAELEAAALRAVLAARPDLPPGRFLSVNVSPGTLGSDAVSEVLDGQADLHGVAIELTEQTPIVCFDTLTDLLDRHRARGAVVALDDAGSGYAGLSHILELRPSILKLDRSLVSGVDQDEAKRILIEMLGQYAGHIDADILAEGIETLAELETLRRLGVSLGQGFVLGRPAAPWAELDGGARAVLAQPPPAAAATGHPASLIVEQVRTVSVDERQRVADGVVLEALDGYAVLVDPHGAPAGVLSPGTGGTLIPILAVSAGTAVSEVATRALLRPYPHRFEPVVCTDAIGRVVGLIRMERVLDLLAKSLGPPQVSGAASGVR
jgi:EAL domain-containing protein (putative c-di-GMP-specific phosphodiesterase class I)